MTMLTVLIFFPLLVALAVLLAPSRMSKHIALLGSLLPIPFFIYIMTQFNWDASAAMQLTGSANWFPAFGISYSLGVDSIAMLLLALTVLLGPLCIACSYTAINTRVKTYYTWLLILQTAMLGVFSARDVILFYTFFEFTLVPLYILISLYGSTNRKAAATKFFLYTFTGSVITLAAIVYVALTHAAKTGTWTFDVAALTETAAALPASTQAYIFFAMILGFAIKVPLFPVHTWLPLAHTEAPTAGSVILAGVLLKLGTYGMLRFLIPFTPEATVTFAPLIAALAVIGIVYAGLVCWVQTDVKKLVAYSSVSHLGFCVLGLFALNSIGFSGSILYMINHGLSTGALFLLIGMIYERYHTRSMKELSGLASQMPIWATFMVFFTMASVGLPGLNGYISEMMCLLGAFQASDTWFQIPNADVKAATGGELGIWYAAIAGTGLIVTAMYLLYMLGIIVWGPHKAPADHHDHPILPKDLNVREITILAPLAIACLALGIYPTPVLKVLEAPTQQLAATFNPSQDTDTHHAESTTPATDDTTVAATPAPQEPALP